MLPHLIAYTLSEHRIRSIFNASHSVVLGYCSITMSDRRGICNCADKSQCVKQGSSYIVDIVETEKSYIATFVMDSAATKHDGKCKCGSSCTCTDCTCG